MDLRASSLGFYRTWYCALGARRGMLRALEARARSPEALAREVGLDAAALARWCRGAHALGLLDRDAKGRYRLRREHRDALGRPDHPDYLGHHFEYLARKSLTFGDLDGLLEGRASDADLGDVYALATRWDHLAFFETFLPREPALRRLLDQGIDVLDMGAGAAGWTILCARRHPKGRHVAAEVDTATVRKARDALRASGLTDAKAVLTRDVPQASFDLVFLGEVLTSPSGAGEVLASCRRALRPGGRLVALEGLLPPPTRQPRGWGEKLILAMDLDFGLDGSAFLTLDEAKRALADAGFVGRKVRDLGGSLYALQGRRPLRG